MMQSSAPRALPVLDWICRELGFELTSEAERQLVEWRQALYEANVTRNLTRVTFGECEARHFAESCLILDFLPPEGRVLDIGTGPGFPAFPLAVVRPDLKVTALDSNGKMLGFLKEHPLPNLEVVHARIEELHWSEEFDIVTGRAVAPLPLQLELSAQACRVGGRVIPFRSTREELNTPYLETLGLRLTGHFIRNVGADSPDRVFPLYDKISPTPRQYPRGWGVMKKAPLG